MEEYKDSGKCVWNFLPSVFFHPMQKEKKRFNDLFSIQVKFFLEAKKCNSLIFFMIEKLKSKFTKTVSAKNLIDEPFEVAYLNSDRVKY